MRKLETVYARYHRQTHEIVVGKWDVICEYDKREYTDPVVINRVIVKTPLCVVEINQVCDTDPTLKAIWSHRDFIGMFLDGFRVGR